MHKNRNNRNHNHNLVREYLKAKITEFSKFLIAYIFYEFMGNKSSG